jgi:hypothetical protein
MKNVETEVRLPVIDKMHCGGRIIKNLFELGVLATLNQDYALRDAICACLINLSLQTDEQGSFTTGVSLLMMSRGSFGPFNIGHAVLSICMGALELRIPAAKVTAGVALLAQRCNKSKIDYSNMIFDPAQTVRELFGTHNRSRAQAVNDLATCDSDRLRRAFFKMVNPGLAQAVAREYLNIDGDKCEPVRRFLFNQKFEEWKKAYVEAAYFGPLHYQYQALLCERRLPPYFWQRLNGQFFTDVHVTCTLEAMREKYRALYCDLLRSYQTALAGSADDERRQFENFAAHHHLDNAVFWLAELEQYVLHLAVALVPFWVGLPKTFDGTTEDEVRYNLLMQELDLQSTSETTLSTILQLTELWLKIVPPDKRELLSVKPANVPTTKMAPDVCA